MYGLTKNVRVVPVIPVCILLCVCMFSVCDV